jgi:precorrin-3B C17-methyltransferase
MVGSIDIVGIGPGAPDQLTPSARDALERAELLVGYAGYLEHLRYLTPGTPRYGTGMMGELERARYAIDRAREGRRVAVVGSGDACVYGLGGLILEFVEDRAGEPELRIHPGITAANAAASLLGAPLMNDYMVLSLSDILTPRERILRRAEAAARAGLALVLYNPKSRSRTELYPEVIRLLLNGRSAATPAGIVREAYRPGQSVILCTLGELLHNQKEVDMLSVVCIADESAFIRNGRIVTPRGYELRVKE